MRILMLSIFSPHFINWASQLEESEHEVYWLDVLDSNLKVERLSNVEQIVGWRYKWNFPGRYALKKKYPTISKVLNNINERSLIKKLEKEIKRIQPEAIHCFVMFLSAVPVYEVIKKRRDIKWIYSAWGSDLYYHQNHPDFEEGIRKVLPWVDYLFTDCKRDYIIARQFGFKGEYLGSFPGGGGFELPELKDLIPLGERNTILVKGYQDELGECINVLNALLKLENEIRGFEVIVFGANPRVFKYLKKLPKSLGLKVLGKISNNELLNLMKNSKIYIGNSRSDGIPNTLLEAIVMGVFPIQSNPGGATAEIITHNKNGMLIEDPENPVEIATYIKMALEDPKLMQKAVDYNNRKIRPFLNRGLITQQVLEKYTAVEKHINA